MFLLTPLFCQTSKVKSALTSAAVTKQLTQKGLRRPQQPLMQARLDRWKRQRRARANDIQLKREAIDSVMADPLLSDRDVIMAKLSDQIFSKGHQHMVTATNITFVPDGNPATPLVAFAGREKVGKTSLLRALFRSAREVGKSNRVLRREGMNYFNVGNVFNVVDLPGLGGTSVPWTNVLQYATLLRNFVRCQPSLKMIYYCLDVNHLHGVYIQDLDMLRFMTKEIPNFTIILTKGEQLSDNSANTKVLQLQDVREELLLQGVEHPVLVTSAFRMGGIDTLRFDMVMNCLHALPTERLTYTEAKRLSDRLFSQEELSSVRQFPVNPTLLDDLQKEWERFEPLEGDKMLTPSMGSSLSPHNEKKEEGPVDGEVTVEIPDEKGNGVTLVGKTSSSALLRFKKRLENKPYLQYVRNTSPWRNPLLWPPNVIPTKSSRVNIMRCPQDPTNPYLYQSHFVVCRADLFFRKSNIGFRKSPQKGRYEGDKPLRSLLKNYTIPYFPDIVDTGMKPAPWMFLGSKEAFYERSEGRRLGISLTNYALDGIIHPVNDNPAPENAQLSNEVQRIESERYAAIAMLELSSE